MSPAKVINGGGGASGIGTPAYNEAFVLEGNPRHISVNDLKNQFLEASDGKQVIDFKGSY